MAKTDLLFKAKIFYSDFRIKQLNCALNNTETIRWSQYGRKTSSFCPITQAIVLVEAIFAAKHRKKEIVTKKFDESFFKIKKQFNLREDSGEQTQPSQNAAVYQ